MAEMHPTDNGANPVMEPSSATGEFEEVSELLHADAGDVSATRVSLEESTAKSITAEHVTLNRSAVKSIAADTLQMTQAAAFQMTSADTAMHDSSAGMITADRVDVFDSVIGAVLGPVTVGEGSTRIFLQVGPADPAARPVLNAQSALGLGAGFGATIVLLSRLLRRLLGN
jgi:3D (Asp-Asp-Asp) domain-containing protein